MENITNIIIIVGVIYIVGWLIAREFQCWYYKSNQILSKIDDLDKNIAKLIRLQFSSKEMTALPKKTTTLKHSEIKKPVQNISEAIDSAPPIDPKQQAANLVKCMHCDTLKNPNNSCPSCHRW